jgi:hypothetical protein
VLPALLTGTFALAAYYGLRCYMNGYYWGGVYLKEASLHPGFDGESTELRRTEIVPTLETPVPRHKNVIWVGRVARQTGSGQPADLRFEVAFPTKLAKDFFPGWAFKDSYGQWASTSSFGMPLNATQEVQILHAAEELRGCSTMPDEFVIDPSPTSIPYQVVVAHVPLRDSLSATLRYVEAQMAAFAQKRDEALKVSWWMEVTIPSVYFQIRDGRQTLGIELNHATQKNGSEHLVSPAGMMGCLPLSIRLDDPFLLLLRKRGTTEPLMVVWIDNAELISPRPPWWPSVLRAFW